MTTYLQGTKSDCDTWKAAIDADAGLPSCTGAVTYGGPDRLDRKNPGPGWTLTVTPAVISVDAATAALEIPDDQASRLGKRGVPTLAQAKDVTALPAPLLAAVRDSKGLQPDGTPKPLPFGQAAPVDPAPAETKGLAATVGAAVRSFLAPPAVAAPPPEPPPEAPQPAPEAQSEPAAQPVADPLAEALTQDIPEPAAPEATPAATVDPAPAEQPKSQLGLLAALTGLAAAAAVGGALLLSPSDSTAPASTMDASVVDAGVDASAD